MDVIEIRPHLLTAPRTVAMVRFLLAQDGFVRWAAPHAPADLRGALSPSLTARAVVGGLLAVWVAARSIAPSGRMAGATTADIDRMAGLPCFGRAMLHAGWLREEAGGLVLPNFREHNPAGPAERRPAGPAPDDGFEGFWASYPRKVAKLDAKRAWAKIRPGKQMAANILAALEAQKRSAEWTREGGKFVPHPATWLNGGRWDDVPAGPLAEDADQRRRKAAEHLRSLSATVSQEERAEVANKLRAAVARGLTKEGT